MVPSHKNKSPVANKHPKEKRSMPAQLHFDTMLFQSDSNTKESQLVRNDSNSSLKLHELPWETTKNAQSSRDLTLCTQDVSESNWGSSMHSLDSCFTEATPTECPRTTRRKKSVSFNQTVKFREIPHHRDMCKARKAALWETVASLKEIRREVIEIVELMNFGLDLSLEMGQRGLMHFCTREKNKRSKTRKEAYLAVFLMQELQEDFWALYEEDGDITEAIGQLYARLSEDAKNEARMRAISDRADALD